MKCCLFCANLVRSSVPQLESEPEVLQIGEAPDDAPFSIPEKWKWVRMFGVAKANPKVTATDLNMEVSFIPMAAVSAGYINQISLREKKSWNAVKNGYTKFANGDILIAKITPCFQNLKSAIAQYLTNGVGCGSSEFHVLRPNENIVDPKYLLMFLKSPWFVAYGIENFKGTAGQQRLGTLDLKNCLFPLPPLSEQCRISAKINQLFAQIDCAEKAYNELSGPLSERFRQLCLQKAIQGKLVPQLESEPEVEQVGDAPEDVPFEIPEKWRWMQLNKVGKIVGGGTPKTSLSEYWDGGTIPWFTPADLGKVHGLYASDSARKITALGLKESSAVMMPPNSVLFSSRAPIGHIALAADSCCTNQGCKSFVPNVGIVLPLWGYFAMKARTPDMIARASGTTFKEISGKGVGETLVPIPPLEEQRRIVTKLSEILNVVRQLENSVLIS